MADKDNKVNMSLDEIIKSERKNKKTRGFAGKKRVFRNVKKGRGRLGPARRGQGNNVKLNAATVRAVNRLVKQAVSRQTNQQLIQRAATGRLRASNRFVAARPAGFRARRAFNVAKPIMGGRLRGVNQRSRVIMSNSARRAQQEPIVLSSTVKPIRGRGASRLGQLVSDEPIVMRRQIVPIVDEEEEIVETVPRRFQRQIIQRRVTPRQREVVVQRPRNVRSVVRQRRIAARPILVESPVLVPATRRRGVFKRYVTVSNARRTQPVFERVQTVQRQNFRATRGPRRQYFNPNAAQMKAALGIGRPANRVVQRFEPSSSFLQRVPAEKRRGRGFQDRY